MKHVINRVARPLLIAVLSGGALNAMAAERVDLENYIPQAGATARSLGDNSLQGQLGLKSDELQSSSSQTYRDGKVVTRYQQYHQGVPVLGGGRGGKPCCQPGATRFIWRYAA